MIESMAEQEVRRQTGHRWIVFDGSHLAAGLILGCRSEADAQRIAASFFPELECRVRPWSACALADRRAAMQAARITPDACERLGVPPPPPPPLAPPPPSIKQHAHRLQQHFARAAAGAGK